MEKKDERQLKRAAEVCALMMQTSRFGANEGGIFRQATDRFVKLLPALEAGDAEQLIRENFLTQPVIMVDLILALGEVGQQAAKGSDVKVRAQSLATQNILLAAHALGLGAVWLGVYPDQTRMDGLRRLVCLPEPVDPLSLIPVGYPAEEVPAVDRYNTDRIHNDRW